MGIEENWKSYVEMTKSKSEGHGKVAEYWDSVHNWLNYIFIFLAAVTTICTLLPITPYVPATLGAMTTLVSALSGFLAAAARRQTQMESSKNFKTLMLKMIRCETERDYEELWKEYNKELIVEPFLPKKYQVKGKINFTMSPEFSILSKKKQAAVLKSLDELESGLVRMESVVEVEEKAEVPQHIKDLYGGILPEEGK